MYNFFVDKFILFTKSEMPHDSLTFKSYIRQLLSTTAEHKKEVREYARVVRMLVLCNGTCNVRMRSLSRRRFVQVAFTMCGFKMDTGEFDDTGGSNAGYISRKNLVQGSATVTFLAELQWDLASSFKGLITYMHNMYVRMYCNVSTTRVIDGHSVPFSASSWSAFRYHYGSQCRRFQTDRGKQTWKSLLCTISKSGVAVH